MHTWQHTFAKHSRIRFGNSPQSCCSVQDGYSYVEYISNVTGSSPGATSTVPQAVATITVPPETCVTCGDAVPCVYSAEIDDYAAWHVHLDWKKPINLRDDEGLNLWLGWERLPRCGGVYTRQPQSIMEAWGGIRLLVEK
jgi:hypothetical protein